MKINLAFFGGRGRIVVEERFVASIAVIMTGLRMETLKKKNERKLSALLVLLALGFWATVAGGLSFEVSGVADLAKKFGETAPIVALAGIVSFWLQNLLGRDLKTRLVFWKFKGNPYPGGEAFSRWLYCDPRIDVSVIKERFDPLPSDPSEQNRLWYKLSKKHENRPSVLDAHGSFLLGRDMLAIWLLFGVLSGALVWFGRTEWVVKVIFDCIVLVGALIVTIVARNNGVRFVTSVLAEESASECPGARDVRGERKAYRSQNE